MGMKGVSLPLGFTFSFPCRQNRLDEVTWSSWRALLWELLTLTQPELGGGEKVELRGGKEGHEGAIVRRGLLMGTSKSELVEVNLAVTTFGMMMVLIKILTTNILKELYAGYCVGLSVHIISFNPHGNI